MEVQLYKQRLERQVMPSAMMLTTDVYWIPLAHDARRSALKTRTVSSEVSR